VRVLAVTNMYPTATTPAAGAFVAAQVESVRSLGVDVAVLHVDRTTAGWAAYRTVAHETRETIATAWPDVVHVMYGGVMADIVTRTVRDRPVLVSFCGSDVLGSGGGGGVVNRVSSRYGVFASRRAARRAAGIVVKAQALIPALPRLDSTPLWVVPNGVDFALFRPLGRDGCRRRLGWAPNRRHVLFGAAPHRPEKRYSLAAAAVAGLADRTVELHALDGVRHEDVPVWLNAADVVVLTSTHEGSPNVVKEALACNVAVVSVDVGDVRERLEGVRGCYVAAATAADIGEKLSLSLAHRGRVAAREGMADLSSEGVARRLVSIYEALRASGVRG
jgi:glycosyltransferase involved in cell wall biosynthesis